jgi:chloramphenicol O-acetyltransferase
VDLAMPRLKFKPDNKVAYDKVPVQFKVLPGIREKLKTVPDWQERLRKFVDELIQEVDNQ